MKADQAGAGSASQLESEEAVSRRELRRGSSFASAAFELIQGGGSFTLAGRRITSIHLALLLLLFFLPVPLVVDNQVVLRTLIYIGIYGIMALAMNIITGWTGQFSVAHAAFYGMGAYTSALLAKNLGVSPWLGMLAGGTVAAVAGAVIGLPTLRLSGPYLALATIGFSESFRVMVIDLVEITGGPNGLVSIPRPMIGAFKISSNTSYLYAVLAMLVCAIFCTRRLIGSRTGRAWVAIREDENAARQMGINTTLYKVSAFTTSAFLVGVMGGFYAHYITFISPESFVVMESITVMSMVVLGGMASIPGSILGPALLLGVERIFSFLFEYRMIIYGFALTGCVIFRPQGILGMRAPVLLAAVRRRFDERQMGTLLARAERHGDTARVGLSSLPRPTEAELAARPRLLEVHNLKKSFGGLAAVDALDFFVRRGEILSVIGPNGSGKTTVFNLIMGALTPDEGRIELAGENLVGLPSFKRVGKGLGRTFQEIRLFLNMTVEENILAGRHACLRTGLWGALLRGPKCRREEAEARERAAEIMALFGDRLLPRRNDFAVSLSYANRRRTEIARALSSDPKLLLLDEPCAGMNPSERREMGELICQLRQRGNTILLIEHHMGLVLEISDRVIVLDHGRCIFEGKPELVRANEEVCRAYMGRVAEGSLGRS